MRLKKNTFNEEALSISCNLDVIFNKSFNDHFH